MKVTIYSKDNCSFCDRAIALAESRELDYNILKLDTDFTLEELKEKFPAARSFPIVIVDDENVGGFKEFQTLIRG